MTPSDLAYGLICAADYLSEQPFIDLMKIGRPWLKGWNEGWTEIEPYLDADGWPMQLPPGWTVIRNTWAIPEIEDDWVLTYDGEGTVGVGRASGGLVVTLTEPGRIEFTSPGEFYLDITATDPLDNGEHVRNIRIFRASHEARVDLGEKWNPDFLATIKDAAQIRFMDWHLTNGSTIETWAERPTQNWYSVTMQYGRTATNGVSVEDMVDLANLTMKHPWFCIPHLADDTYVQTFAEYVRDNLDPALVATIEYSNEVWNFAPGFGQTFWADQEAQDLWGTDSSGPLGGARPNNLDYQAMRATQVAKICADVFVAARSRLVNVLGLQNGNAWWLQNRMLNALVWNDRGTPTPILNPPDHFDAVAVSSYFGAILGYPDRKAELVAYLDEHTLDEAYDWMKANLLDPDYDESIPKIVTNWTNVKTVCDANGLDLILYEGGQHVAQGTDNSSLTPEQITKLNAFLNGFVRTQQMADLYEELWDQWIALPGDGPFMQYVAVGNGTWGAILNNYDLTLRQAAMLSKVRGIPHRAGYVGVTAVAA